MAFQGSKNVWGKCNRNFGNIGNEGRRASLKLENNRGFGNSQVEQGTNNKGLLFGPFGSKSESGTNNGPFGKSSGPTSLPNEGVQGRSSKIFKFELGSCSSGSSCSSSAGGSGPNSMLAFGMEPIRYNWSSIGLPKTDQLPVGRSGGSSRTSSCSGSQSRLNLGSMVENIFKEEIGKMAESFHRETCFGTN
jgi:hypothetical protein